MITMDWRETLKCRACLTEDSPLLPLFEVYEHNLTLADILQNCLNSEVPHFSGVAFEIYIIFVCL